MMASKKIPHIEWLERTARGEVVNLQDVEPFPEIRAEDIVGCNPMQNISLDWLEKLWEL